jgi:hypothetical protein
MLVKLTTFSLLGIDAVPSKTPAISIRFTAPPEHGQSNLAPADLPFFCYNYPQ